MSNLARDRAKLRSPLARRLIVGIVLVSSAITLCLTAVQLYGEYRHELGSIQTVFRQVEAVHLKALSQSLWATNTNDLRLQLEGLVRVPHIEYVAVREGDKLWAQAGRRASGSVIERQYPMTYDHRDRSLEIGTLTVTAGLDAIYRQLFTQAFIVLAGNALKTFLVAGFAFLFFHWLVNRHLLAISAYVRGLDVHKPSPPLALARPARARPDELDELVAAIARMLENAHLTLAALRERERRLDDMLANLDLIAVILDTAGRVTFCNDYLLKLTGWRREEVLGEDWFAKFVPGDRDDVRRLFIAALPAGDIPLHYENPVLTREGEGRVVRWSNTMLRDVSGAIVGTASVGEDITERKRAEEALRESERFLSSLTGDLPGMAYRCRNDKDWTMEFVSDGCLDLIGYPASDLIGNRKASFGDLVHPDDQGWLWEKCQRSLEDRVPCKNEYRVITSTGDVKWVWDQSHGIYSDSGELLTIEGFITDITERRRAGEALRESEANYRTLVESASDTVLVSDGRGRLMDVNAAGCRMFGYTREELLTMSNTDIIAADEVLRGPPEMARLRVGDVVRSEWQCRRKDGTLFPGEVSATVLPDGRLLGIVRDMTERKRAEEKIQRLNRVYAMLSGINALIVRARDRDELFREACRLAVEVGEFQIAWVGLVDRAAMRVQPVVWSGAERGLLQAIEPYLSLREGPEETRAMVARVINEKTPLIVNDVDREVRAVLKTLLVERDIHSIAAFPLMIADEATGALVLLAKAPGFFDEGETRLLVELAGDIAFALDHIEKAERINYLAYYDSLTGLANRSLFHDRLTQFVHTAQRERRQLAMSVIDLDHFKDVNDALGRQSGDALLVQFAQRLTHAVADVSQIARLGADRFALVLPDTEDEADVLRTIEKIVTQCVSTSFALAGSDLHVATKVGIALYPKDGADADALFRNAEAALKKAKGGAEQFLFYDQQMTERVGEKLALESRLRRARESEEFALYYQPKVDAKSRRVTGVEALIRWLDPQMGTILPAKFIPLLEETGIILDVGAWAIRRAIQDQAYWRAHGVVAPRIAVNVSAVQLRQRDFVDIVRDAVEQEERSALIELEITESLLMENIEESINTFKSINGLGVNVAIDDFGTGYSSLGYLARLPVQALKIDLSFIARMLNDPGTLTLVTTMISLAHSLGLTVVAEGVETEEQAVALQQLGCDELQGYLISPPVPRDQMTELLRRTSLPAKGKTRIARKPR